MKTLQLKKDFYWSGIIDADLRVFDIIMATEFGTTYNSYILKSGGKTVLFETAKEKFYDDYEATLKEQLDVTEIDYIVVSHTEPDHAGSIAKIIERCPRAQVIATPVAISFLKHIVNRDFYSIPVKDQDEIKIGEKTLRFFSLPNLHWPDTMYTYIVEDKTLVTCDSFGSHYAHEGILRSTVTDEEGYLRATKYYYDNILGPFDQPFMKAGIDLVKSLDVDMICPGHGPVLDCRIDEILAIYESWSNCGKNDKLKVVIPYVSAYGYTGELAQEIEKGILASGDIEVKLYDMVTSDQGEVLGEIGSADGLLFGTPTILEGALKPIWDLVTSLYAPIHMNKVASAFGSYGWSGEGVPQIVERLKQIKMNVVEGFRVRLKPSETDLVNAYEFGFAFGLKLLAKDEVKPKVGKSGKVKCLVCEEIFDEGVEICPVCGVSSENFVPIIEEEIAIHNDTNESYVILGGGAAALNAAKAIRARNNTASITIVSEEANLPYNRPMLTKNMFVSVRDEVIETENKAWYEANNISVLLQTKVISLDTTQKTVLLSGEKTLSYDKCIYALGSYSFIPPIKGADQDGVTALRTIDDLKKIHTYAADAKTAVVIGGGVLGLEAAWELCKLNVKVTVLEGAPMLLAGKVDATTSNKIAKLAEDEGMRVVVGAKISEIVGDGKATGVALADGEVVSADFVIVSTGVRANIAVAKEAGIATDRAVIVDESMATNVEGVYACGDCAQFEGMNISIWPVATEMGKIAGANAAGDSLTYQSKLYGMSFAGLGTTLFAMGDVGTKPDVSYKTVEINDDKKKQFEKYVFVNNVICGAILLGDISKMAEITTAIEQKLSFKELF